MFRSPTLNTVAVLCAVLAGFVISAEAQTITSISTWGPPPVGDDISIAYAVNSNGSVVVGSATAPAGTRAFRWTPVGGIQDLGLLLGTTEARAYDVSNNGNVIIGEAVSGVPEPFRWTNTGGLTSLGIPGGSARGVSADGLVVAGTMATGSGGFYRWTTTGGFQNLGVYPGTGNSVAFGLSPDGSTIVGRGGLGVFGPTNHAVKWSVTGGWVDLGLSGNYAQAIAASTNGSYVVGEANYAFPTFIHAVRWDNAAVLEDLGIPANAAIVSAQSVSSDGTVVGGTIGPQAGATRAFIWNSLFGFEDLDQYLTNRGVNVTNWQLYELRGISADGTALVGWGRENFAPRAFVVRGLPPVCGPYITAQPTGSVGCVGGVVSMFVDAFGPTIFIPQFQWQKAQTDGEWNDLPNFTTGFGSVFSGTNTPVLTISNCAAQDVPGNYRCMVTAGCASRATVVAVVSLINQTPVFTAHPSDTFLCPGDSAVLVAGPPTPPNGPYTYQWERETFANSGIFVTLTGGFTYPWDGNLPGYGGIVTGQFTSTLTIAPDVGNGRVLGPAHGRNYRCVVSNPCGATNGLPAGLKVFTSCITGDANCDGGVTVSDIGSFVLLLTDPVQYELQNPSCNPQNGDLNGDDIVTVSDIGPFVSLLTGG